MLVHAAHDLFEIRFWRHCQEADKRLEEYGDDDLHLWDMVTTLGTLPREVTGYGDVVQLCES
mgnify:CR=1 FL=1